MMPTRCGLLGVPAGLLTLFVALGCGEITDSPSTGQGGQAGSAMGTGAAGQAGSSGAGGMSLGGSGGNDEPDAGPEMGGSGGSGEFMYPEGCPQPNAVPADRDQDVVIQSVNFATSEIVIRNVTSGPVLITGGQMGWQWCNIPGYDLVVYDDVTLEPGQTLAFYLIQNGGDVRPLYNGADVADPNELGIYTTSGSFDETDLIAAFVSWGEGHDTGREVVAASGNKWIFGERIVIGPGHRGFIITGNADEGAGYTSVPLRCLVSPPNPPGVVVPMPPP